MSSLSSAAAVRRISKASHKSVRSVFSMYGLSSVYGLLQVCYILVTLVCRQDVGSDDGVG